jgi:elongation factor P
VISTGEIKRGITVEIDGQLYQIVEFQQVRMKLRNVRRGDTIEKTVQAGERFQRARLDHRTVQFLYNDGDLHHFMDTQTYEQFALDEKVLGDATDYLVPNMEVVLDEYQGDPIGVELPASVVMTVASTDHGIKGDTATGPTKPATMESGLKVNVPLFVNPGDKIKVDTRSGEYLERA